MPSVRGHREGGELGAGGGFAGPHEEHGERIGVRPVRVRISARHRPVEELLERPHSRASAKAPVAPSVEKQYTSPSPSSLGSSSGAMAISQDAAGVSLTHNRTAVVSVRSTQRWSYMQS